MPDFNFSAMANVIAQHTGTFSGLAFAALLLYFGQSKMPGHTKAHIGVVSSLLVACFAMWFNAFYFAIIASTHGPQVATLMLVHIQTLAISLLLLLLAVAIASGNVASMVPAKVLCKYMTIVIGPVILSSFNVLAVFALSQQDCGGCNYLSARWYSSPTIWGLLTMLAVLVTTLVLARLPVKIAKTHRPYVLPAAMGVGMIGISALLHIAISLFTPLEYHASDNLLIGYVLGSGVLIISFAWLCANALRHVPQQTKKH